MTPDSGFSLIELIIVCLIISILAVSAIPVVSRHIRLYRAEWAVGMISNRITEARLSAIKRNRPTWLDINKNDNSLRLGSTDFDGNKIYFGAVDSLPAGTILDKGSELKITFTSLGRNKSSSTTKISLKFPQTGQCKFIFVSPNGKISTSNC